MIIIPKKVFEKKPAPTLPFHSTPTGGETTALFNKLSAVPEAKQCGWLKDRYGVSWQIVPTAMDEMMSKGTPEQTRRVTEAFLTMKKFDLAKLQKAYNEK